MNENVTSLEEYRAQKDDSADEAATLEEAQGWCDHILDILTGGSVTDELRRTVDGLCDTCHRASRRYTLGRFNICHKCARRRLGARAEAS